MKKQESPTRPDELVPGSYQALRYLRRVPSSEDWSPSFHAEAGENNHSCFHTPGPGCPCGMFVEGRIAFTLRLDGCYETRIHFSGADDTCMSLEEVTSSSDRYYWWVSWLSGLSIVQARALRLVGFRYE